MASYKQSETHQAEQEMNHKDKPINREQRASRTTKKPWYNQGWMWLIVVVVVMGVFFFLFQGLIDQLSQLTQATQEQTEAIEGQNQILSGIKEKMNDLIIELKRVASDVTQAIENQTKA